GPAHSTEESLQVSLLEHFSRRWPIALTGKSQFVERAASHSRWKDEGMPEPLGPRLHRPRGGPVPVECRTVMKTVQRFGRVDPRAGPASVGHLGTLWGGPSSRGLPLAWWVSKPRPTLRNFILFFVRQTEAGTHLAGLRRRSGAASARECAGH